MGYDVHITRKENWFEEEPAISLSEWLAVVDADPEMRHDGFAEVRSPAGDLIRVAYEGLSVWTAHSRHGIDGGMVWFGFRGGNVVVKNPDPEILRKMSSLARSLSAKVQGDEGETYDEHGRPRNTSELASRAESTTRPWWKLW